MRGGTCAVGLAEGVPAGDQRDGLFIVHRHAPEGLADVAGGGHGVRFAVRTLGIHINETHLHGGLRIGELALAGVARIRAEPGFLSAPRDVVIGLPDIRAARSEPEGLEAHALERDISGQDHKVGPGYAATLLLLDRPQQASGLLEIGVVRPAVEGREPLLSPTPTAAAVAGAVGTGAVPGHANEERTVVAKVRGPPVLRVRHEGREILLQGRVVELRECLGIVEARSHRVGFGGVLLQKIQRQVLWPPVFVGSTAPGGVGERALGFGRAAHVPAPVAEGWCSEYRTTRSVALSFVSITAIDAVNHISGFVVTALSDLRLQSAPASAPPLAAA